MSNKSGSFVVRPAVRAFLRASGVRFIAFAGMSFLLATQLYLSKGKAGGAALVVPSLAALLVFAVVWHGLYLLNVRVEVEGGRVTFVDRFGRRRVRLQRDVAGIASRAVTWEGVPVPATTVFVIYQAGHRALVVLPGVYWADRGVQSLRNVFGPPGPLHAKAVDVKVLDREFPGSVPFWQRHNWLTAVILVASLGLVFFLLLRGQSH